MLLAINLFHFFATDDDLAKNVSLGVLAALVVALVVISLVLYRLFRRERKKRLNPDQYEIIDGDGVKCLLCCGGSGGDGGGDGGGGDGGREGNIQRQD